MKKDFHTFTMSLDKLFHQILLAEQHLSEQTQKFKEVKAAVVGCNSHLKAATEKYQKTTEELDVKGQQLSAMRLRWDLMTKCDEQIAKQVEDLLSEKARLRERLARMKAEFQDEEQKFLQEIWSFNGEFSLCAGTEASARTHMEALNLDMEVHALYKEMEEMMQKNGHMSNLLTQKRNLHLELQALKSVRADLERQLSRAEKRTATMRAQAAGHRTSDDGAVVMMRNELEMHQEGDLELLLETLKMEVRHLQSKLDSRKGGEQP
ncbi:coiled-coil domain-containing protein 172-like isoform X2 [Vanacampus margaritifer]